ncbi:MAG TPA: DinB family protein [Candidatus Acidoferrales bacterium]
MNESRQEEPWLRGTLNDVAPVPRAVVHALELAKEDIERWCGGLSDDQINARPFGIAPLAFHIRHIARSIDRLLTYAEARPLTAEQFAALKTELDDGATQNQLVAELGPAFEKSVERIRALDATRLNDPREVGRQRRPTTVGGLLIHVAEHTQRHVGQAITTAKIVTAQHQSEC